MVACLNDFSYIVPARNFISPARGTCHRSPTFPIVLITEDRVRGAEPTVGAVARQA